MPESIDEDVEREVPDPVPMDVPVDPHYNTSITIGLLGEKPWHAEFEKPAQDPFATIAITMSVRDILRALWRMLRQRKPLRIQTSVGGDWDAIKHVMTVRDLHAMLPPDQAAARAVDAAFAEQPDELDLRRHRTQPHAIWYWIEDPNDPIPAPHSTTLDNADDAEARARKLIADEDHALAARGLTLKDSRLAWVKVFRADNENYETFRWERES